jgi:hypothetical protein
MNANKHLNVVLIIFISTWIIGCSTNSPQRHDAGEVRQADDEVTDKLFRIEDEWAALDMRIGKDPKAVRAVLERIWAPDYVGTGRDGKVRNKHDSIAAYADDGVESAVNSDMAVHIYADNVAVVTGIDNTKGKDQAGNRFSHQDIFTDTYVKRDGVWQCVTSHNARIK